MQPFLSYILPALIGAVSAVVCTWCASKVKKREITVDDNTALRNALMLERQQLVREIRDLQKRCDALEEQNSRQASELLSLRIENRELIEKITHFQSVR